MPKNMPDRITNWLDPDAKDHTQWGHITNREWLEHEKARNAAKGAATEIRTKSGSAMIALFRVPKQRVAA